MSLKDKLIAQQADEFNEILAAKARLLGLGTNFCEHLEEYEARPMAGIGMIIRSEKFTRGFKDIESQVVKMLTDRLKSEGLNHSSAYSKHDEYTGTSWFEVYIRNKDLK